MKLMKKIIDSKKYRVVDLVIFIIGLVAANAYTVKLFYRQAMYSGGGWQSDLPSYIEEIQGINERYSYPYPVLFKVGKFFDIFTTPEWAIVLAVVLFNVLGMIIVKRIFDKQTGTKLLATGSTFCLFFLSMIYSDVFKSFGLPYKYRGVYSPNPWQNATYMAARPFMIIAFVYCAITLATYEKDFEKGNKLSKDQLTNYIIFAVALLIATMAKPSYTLVHMGAVGLVMVYRFFKNKCKTFRQTLIMGLFYVPTIIDMLYQYTSEFTGKSGIGVEQGIGIGLFKVWGYYVGNIPLAIILGTAFPILVLVFHHKMIKTDEQFRLSWQIYLMGFAMAAVFYEKGDRINHGNFMWGYICGLCLVFFTSIILLLKDTKEFMLGEKLGKQAAILTIQWILLAIHTLMGLKYFYYLMAFGMDYF